MKELIRIRVQYASRHQCCKTNKRPLPFLPSFPFTPPPLRHRVPSRFNWTLPAPATLLRRAVLVVSSTGTPALKIVSVYCALAEEIC